jgi:hypothetical protein
MRDEPTVTHKPPTKDKERAKKDKHKQKSHKAEKEKHVNQEPSEAATGTNVTYPEGRPEATQILDGEKVAPQHVFGTSVLLTEAELKAMPEKTHTADQQPHVPTREANESPGLSEESVERSESGALRFHEERQAKTVTAEATSTTAIVETQASPTVTGSDALIEISSERYVCLVVCFSFPDSFWLLVFFFACLLVSFIHSYFLVFVIIIFIY